MIELDRVTYTYPGAGAPILRDLSIRIADGELLLVCGPSGAGKSTLLRLFNGLVPHFYGGRLSGRVRVWGRDTLAHQPRDLADLIGFVVQDPESQFVVERVEDEIVFAMENLGVPPAVMRRRVEEVLDQLAIAHLRHRHVATLSGGEQQRVAIAAALAAQPRALVLDEPTSQLDPHGAEEVLTALQKLNADLGITIVLCEHRLERVVQYADRILYLAPGGRVEVGAPREMLARIELRPPLQQLGVELGWEPLPLTIKEGRRFVTADLPVSPPSAPTPLEHQPLARLRNVTVQYGQHEALYRLNLDLPRGALIALMGRNGSGKSTLLKTLIGLVRPVEGKIEVEGRDIAPIPVEELARRVAYVPQDPRSMLFHDTLREEVAFSLHGRGLQPSPTTIAEVLARFDIHHLAERYPRDLSGGEAQRAALAAGLAGDPSLILLDEPTRGLDYHAKASLISMLRRLCDEGRTVVMATHDVELAAACADRVVLLSEGEVVVEGPATELLGNSLIFSSQVAKLFPGRGWLTVAQALAGLRGGCMFTAGDAESGKH
ncbi:ABC transporter ATP-binding protein [uncultured Chloroflexus sp.]|uniref:ABC transporter ATP-binding protein n=1 Tax=uncultured Chloroflexus sp. TaxID=214040 RepID=UPI002605DB9D|nr:ATP-binding cassette domain-containing protein [uncultured Chloroflexus sp.]